MQESPESHRAARPLISAALSFVSGRSPAPLHSSPGDSDAPAHWLTSRIDFFATNWATSTVTTGYEGYARVLHPLDDTTHAPRWATS